ncbi:unnamed protein product [Agarophyton chilense]
MDACIQWPSGAPQTTAVFPRVIQFYGYQSQSPQLNPVAFVAFICSSDINTHDGTMSEPFSSSDEQFAPNDEPDSPPPLSRNPIFHDNQNPLQRAMMWPPVNPNQPPIWLRRMNNASETCVFKAGISAFAGGGLGVLFGLFFGGYSNAVDKAVETEGPASLKLRVGFKEAARSMRSYAKNFAWFGASFSAAECTVEKIRARHDIWNSVIGGCVAGAFMSSSPSDKMTPRARAMQMAFGCASVGAFSAAIDYYMEYMD